MGLTQHYYTQALHWFHSTAWSAKKLSAVWHEWLLANAKICILRGQPVYIGDGIKVGKEGKKMPAVKRLHQESENVSKPKWIRGHYFGAISLLIQSAGCNFAVPITFEIQDGIKDTAEEEITLVDKMSALSVEVIETGAYIIMDAYFASKKLIKQLREHQLNLVTRVRINTVGKHSLPPPPAKRGRGKPPTWGKAVKLSNLFIDKDSFTTETLLLYGKQVLISYRSIDLHWDCPKKCVLCWLFGREESK